MDGGTPSPLNGITRTKRTTGQGHVDRRKAATVDAQTARGIGRGDCDALDDPTVVEIVVNDDSSLFIERLGERMIKVREGFDAKRAEAIIGTIASFLSTTCTRESPILSGEMPTLGARFQGLLPPIVARPSFAIRKKASAVFPLEVYVEQGIMTAPRLPFCAPRYAID